MAKNDLPLTGVGCNVAFIATDGQPLCIQCAMGRNDSRVPEVMTIASDCPDDKQWQIIGVQDANSGDFCAHCGDVFPIRQVGHDGKYL